MIYVIKFLRVLLGYKNIKIMYSIIFESLITNGNQLNI